MFNNQEVARQLKMRVLNMKMKMRELLEDLQVFSQSLAKVQKHQREISLQLRSQRGNNKDTIMVKKMNILRGKKEILVHLATYYSLA